MIDNSTYPKVMRHPVGLLGRSVTQPPPGPRPLAPGPWPLAPGPQFPAPRTKLIATAMPASHLL